MGGALLREEERGTRNIVSNSIFFSSSSSNAYMYLMMRFLLANPVNGLTNADFGKTAWDFAVLPKAKS